LWSLRSRCGGCCLHAETCAGVKRCRVDDAGFDALGETPRRKQGGIGANHGIFRQDGVRHRRRQRDWTWHLPLAVAKAEFFIFTHEEPREWIEARHQRLMEGFESIERYNARDQAT
jgi:hypothetical protein